MNWRTPLDLYMTLNGLTNREVAKAIGCNVRIISLLRSGRARNMELLGKIERAYGLFPGSLGSFRSVFRQHPLIWYRIDRTNRSPKCRWCGKPITDWRLSYTTPFIPTRMGKRSMHVECFIHALDDLKSDLQKAIEKLLEDNNGNEQGE